MLFIMTFFLFLLPENLLAAEVQCQNVTFAEHYKFTWKDENIEQINVTVFLGTLCDGGIMTFRISDLFLCFLDGNSVKESLIN